MFKHFLIKAFSIICLLCYCVNSEAGPKCECGEHLVSHGEILRVGEFPHHALIKVAIYRWFESGDDTNWFIRTAYGIINYVMWVLGYSHKAECGGSVLNSRFILTSATCLKFGGYKARSGDLSVILGKTRVYDPFQNMEYVQGVNKFSVEEVIIHKDFDPENVRANDVAMLRLASELHMSTNISAICLPPPPPAHPVTLLSTGFIKLNGTTTRQLIKLDLTEVPFTQCEGLDETYPDDLDDTPPKGPGGADPPGHETATNPPGEAMGPVSGTGLLSGTPPSDAPTGPPGIFMTPLSTGAIGESTGEGTGSVINEATMGNSKATTIPMAVVRKAKTYKHAVYHIRRKRQAEGLGLGKTRMCALPKDLTRAIQSSDLNVGSAIISIKESRYFQIGILSHILGSGSDLKLVFTRVSPFKSWIEGNMNDIGDMCGTKFGDGGMPGEVGTLEPPSSGSTELLPELKPVTDQGSVGPGTGVTVPQSLSSVPVTGTVVSGSSVAVSAPPGTLSPVGSTIASTPATTRSVTQSKGLTSALGSVTNVPGKVNASETTVGPGIHSRNSIHKVPKVVKIPPPVTKVTKKRHHIGHHTGHHVKQNVSPKKKVKRPVKNFLPPLPPPPPQIPKKAARHHHHEKNVV